MPHRVQEEALVGDTSVPMLSEKALVLNCRMKGPLSAITEQGSGSFIKSIPANDLSSRRFTIRLDCKSSLSRSSKHRPLSEIKLVFFW